MPVRCGDDLFSMAVDSTADAQDLAERLRETGEWLEVVAGIASVVVRFDAINLNADAAQQRIMALAGEGGTSPRVPGELLQIPVVYGGKSGPDLDKLCRNLGISKEEFIDLHTGRDYPVEMVGFTPGFAFVGGLDDRLRVPRRNKPRQRVAAGSVGIADGRTGLYAIASPGGWRLIGRTPLVLFDPNATEPFVVRAGMRVRFEAVAAGEIDE